MNAIYGWRGQGPRRVPLPPPEATYAPQPPPPKVYAEHSPRCIGCPYPRHGLSCQNRDDGSCLRTDMQELEAKWLEQWQTKKDTIPAQTL